MFHHHEIVFSIVSGFAGTRKMEGKRGKITKLTVEIVKRRRNWKLCKNKVVNQYECPVVIHKRRSEKCAEKQKKNIHNCTTRSSFSSFVLRLFLPSHTGHCYTWHTRDGHLYVRRKRRKRFPFCDVHRKVCTFYRFLPPQTHPKPELLNDEKHNTTQFHHFGPKRAPKRFESGLLQTQNQQAR